MVRGGFGVCGCVALQDCCLAWQLHKCHHCPNPLKITPPLVLQCAVWIPHTFLVYMMISACSSSSTSHENPPPADWGMVSIAQSCIFILQNLCIMQPTKKPYCWPDEKGKGEYSQPAKVLRRSHRHNLTAHLNIEVN